MRALLGERGARRPKGPWPAAPPEPPTAATDDAPGPEPAPARRPGPPAGLALALAGLAAAYGVHLLLPAVPMLSVAIVLGVVAAHLPGVRGFVRGRGRPGLSLAGKRLMRIGVVLLGLKLSLDDVFGLGWATVGMVGAVVAATFGGTLWLGRRLGLRGDQPLLIATGYSICGASAIGAVSEVRDSDERDVATSVALVTLCGTFAIGVLPLLHGPLGLTDGQFGRWAGAGVHDVGQVVATAQTAGSAALGEAVLVKLIRVAMLAPLVAVVALGAVRRRRVRRAEDAAAVAGDAGASAPGTAVARAFGRLRTPLVPLFVLGFLAMVVLRTTGQVPSGVLQAADTAKELLLGAALFGLGSAVHLPTLARTGVRVAVLGLCAWAMIAGVSYAGVVFTT